MTRKTLQFLLTIDLIYCRRLILKQISCSQPHARALEYSNDWKHLYEINKKQWNNSTIKTSTVSSDICICYWAIDLLQPVSLKCDAICELWMVIFSSFRPINQTGAEKVQHEVFFLKMSILPNWNENVFVIGSLY